MTKKESDPSLLELASLLSKLVWDARVVAFGLDLKSLDPQVDCDVIQLRAAIRKVEDYEKENRSKDNQSPSQTTNRPGYTTNIQSHR